jgi:putative ABC transport system permease protein
MKVPQSVRTFFSKLIQWTIILGIVAGIIYYLKFRPIEVVAHRIKLGAIVAETMGTGTLEAKIRTTISPKGMVGQGGDGVAFFTIADALAIQLDVAAEQSRLEREARGGRLVQTDMGRLSPELLEHAKGLSANIPCLPQAPVSAILVQVRAGFDPERLAQIIRGWKDVSVYTTDAQKELLLKGSVDRSRRQLALFRALLVVISAIIMALILYTLTLDKLHDIAMLKLMGARNSVIIGLILQQAVLLGALGYGIAYLFGLELFPKFPRRVIIVEEDLIVLAGIVLFISIISSLLGIWKAMRVEPSAVLS